MRVSKGRSKYAFTITIENRAEAIALWHRFSVGPHQPLMRYLKWSDTSGEYDEEVFAEMWRIFNGSFPLRKIEREEVTIAPKDGKSQPFGASLPIMVVTTSDSDGGRGSRQ